MFNFWIGRAKGNKSFIDFQNPKGTNKEIKKQEIQEFPHNWKCVRKNKLNSHIRIEVVANFRSQYRNFWYRSQ